MSWEDSYDNWKTSPPDEPEPLLSDEFGNPIWEGEDYYEINGWIISEDGLDECGDYLDDGETFTCGICEDEFSDDYSEKYYLINGDKFCEECVLASKTRATRGFGGDY